MSYLIKNLEIPAPIIMILLLCILIIAVFVLIFLYFKQERNYEIKLAESHKNQLKIMEELTSLAIMVNIYTDKFGDVEITEEDIKKYMPTIY